MIYLFCHVTICYVTLKYSIFDIEYSTRLLGWIFYIKRKFWYMRRFMRTTPSILSVFCVFMVCSISAEAQLPVIKKVDSLTASDKAKRQVLQTYFDRIGAQAAIYVGIEETEYPSNYLQHPYFKIGTMMPGTIWYDGVEYSGVRLRYDKVKDQVVLESPDSAHRIVLASDHVNQFYVQDQLFVRHVQDKTPGSPATGFYALLCDGEVQLILSFDARYDEQLQNRTESNHTISYALVENPKYYLWKDGAYYHLRSRKDLIDLFEDREEELTDFIKSHQLRFKAETRADDYTECVNFLNAQTR